MVPPRCMSIGAGLRPLLLAVEHASKDGTAKRSLAAESFDAWVSLDLPQDQFPTRQSGTASTTPQPRPPAYERVHLGEPCSAMVPPCSWPRARNLPKSSKSRPQTKTIRFGATK
jgi:hypothetical protein